MSSKVKEEERIEKIIRNLLKLPENRRCINCNTLGPQYVCTTFWTFVCTNCSGIHREFTHRVKSVSMAKFNAEEVNALQAGGNERARQIYFKLWDPQVHTFPDRSDQSGLREFIRLVYVNRALSGDRSSGRLAMVKAGVKNDSSERKSIERPSPRGCVDDRGTKYYIEERRSPQYKTDKAKSGTPRSRPANFEIVDDRFRDGGRRSGRQSDTSREGSKSPVSQKSRENNVIPKVRPVTDILGENLTPLRVGEAPKANNSRSSANGQRTSSDDSVDRKSLEQKAAFTGSLIDFGADIEPPDSAAASETKLADLSIDGGSGASVQSSTAEQPSASSSVNSLESLLFGLTSPAAAPADTTSESQNKFDAPSTAHSIPSNIGGATLTAPATTVMATASSAGLAPAGSLGMAPALPTSSSNSMTSWNSSTVPNTQSLSSRESSNMAQDTTVRAGSQSISETKSCGRNELPADLFVSSFSSFPANVPAWQLHPPHVAQFGMQYRPAAVPTPANPNSVKSRNPFELNDETTQAQGAMNPSTLPVHGAIPNLPASTAMFHTHPSQLMQLQGSPYSSVALAQIPYQGMHASPGVLGQLPNNIPLNRPQHSSPASGGGGDAFASLNPILGSNKYPAPPPSSAAGNPFG